MDERQIVEALKTIKAVCDDIGDSHCEKCPLCNLTGDCGLMDLSPCNWTINDPGKVWRALL